MLQYSTFFIKAAEETVAAGSVVTEYSDVRFPVSQIIALIFAIGIMIAVSIYSIVFIARRGTNWTYSLMSVIFYCLLFNYLPVFALQYIPAVRTFSETNPRSMQFISISVSIVLEALSLFIGSRIVVKQSQKRGYYIDITTALLFGAVYYIISVLILDQIMTCFTWLAYGTTLNSMGFDAFVESLMNGNNISQEDAVAAALDMVNTKPLYWIWNSLISVVEIFTRSAAAIVFYGYFTREIDKSYLFYGFGFEILEYIACLIVVLFNLSSLYNLLLQTAVAAVSCFLVYTKLLKGPMSADMYTLTHKKEKKKPKTQNGADPNKKMPTINMPKD